MRRVGLSLFVVGFCCAPLRTVSGEPEEKVPAAVTDAIVAYLEAKPKKEKAALEKALKALGGDLALAERALLALPPLSRAKAKETRHGVEFESLGETWTYSVYLPEGYDGKTRFPVLAPPDHGSVDEEAGIGFWRDKWGDRYILFRPVIVRFQEDKKRFPEQQFLVRDRQLAQVFFDALAHLRLHFAADPERVSMTGLSQAGFYTWYYALSFPDDFAAIVPESAGGQVLPALVYRHANNLAALKVRILHAEGDQITPYANAKEMHDRLKAAGASVELITYTDADYGEAPFPKRHPGPHHLRLKNVLPWACEQTRAIPSSFTRQLRHTQQGREGRFEIPPPKDPTKPFDVTCSEKDGALAADAKGVSYLVSPADLLAGKAFTVDGKAVTPEPDLALLLREFKRTGDRGRLVAARIEVTR
jgi:predicted esterase